MRAHLPLDARTAGDMMAMKRYTAKQIKKLKDRTDYRRVERMTDEEIEAAARSDPDAPPCTRAQLKKFRKVTRAAKRRAARRPSRSR